MDEHACITALWPRVTIGVGFLLQNHSCIIYLPEHGTGFSWGAGALQILSHMETAGVLNFFRAATRNEIKGAEAKDIDAGGKASQISDVARESWPGATQGRALKEGSVA